ncbi:olfactory receptor 5V1-like [Pelodiscus sinensis]|uniref:olfactory receptor 5V1-like n=1 Tax=Pelodiscus sinensis TaxID=13735 RepID=UPI003F6D55DF
MNQVTESYCKFIQSWGPRLAKLRITVGSCSSWAESLKIRGMEKGEGRNQTPIVEFILLGFGNDPELQPLLFFVFLMIYLVTLAGNLLIVLLVVTDRHLHSPMYFFLGNLACLETGFTSTILPRFLTSLLTGDRAVPVKGCIIQLYVFSVTSSAENLLLTAMSYDRYLAICHPLRYTALMNGRVCCQIVAGCWISSFLGSAVVNIFLWKLTFCNSNEIDHFFCDFTPMLKLSCDDTQILQLLAFIVAALWTLVPFLLTLASYVCIISSILGIPSTTGRQKAFSTCSSHLIVVMLYYVIVIVVYLVPIVNPAEVPKKIISVFCTVLTQMINPFIYCLRNKDVKESLRKTLHKQVAVRNTPRI